MNVAKSRKNVAILNEKKRSAVFVRFLALYLRKSNK